MIRTTLTNKKLTGHHGFLNFQNIWRSTPHLDLISPNIIFILVLHGRILVNFLSIRDVFGTFANPTEKNNKIADRHADTP